MEASELDKNLGELEEKMERVRALYEQFFVGIEKIEPQIPRKDVDRRITLLRKEQIRNTAMRFKFQTLVQRYNTMQQHWMRTMREIENGTFKRDLLKAAARFGVDEALTAMGKKHAARLKGVVDRQRGKSKKDKEEVYEELSSSDLEFAEDLRAELGGALDEDDDAPTPPPQRVYELPDPSTDVADLEVTHAGDDHLAATAAHAAANSAVEEPKPLRHLFPKARGPKPRAIEIPAEPARDAGGFGVIDPLDALPPSEFAAAPAASSADASASGPGSAGKKGGGGLRWGGGGARKADPEVLKRMASLAGVEAGEAPPAAAAPPLEARTRKPLLSSPLDLGIPDEPTVAPAKVEPPVRKPLLSNPIDIDLGLPASEPPPPPPPPKPVAAAPAPVEPAPEMRRPQPARLRPPEPAARSGETTATAPKPTASQSEAREAPKREFGDLNDGRLREIYAQYVQARRDRNESTAGITFEKLSDSLKTQAEKLKGQHKKRVDYEVVVKDGKTLIKPIVK